MCAFWADNLRSTSSIPGVLHCGMARGKRLTEIETQVHLTAYVEKEDGIYIWVPRRSRTKSTYGGMLDNTVAGGISSGMGVLETVVKESMEEASIPE